MASNMLQVTSSAAFQLWNVFCLHRTFGRPGPMACCIRSPEARGYSGTQLIASQSFKEQTLFSKKWLNVQRAFLIQATSLISLFSPSQGSVSSSLNGLRGPFRWAACFDVHVRTPSFCVL